MAALLLVVVALVCVAGAVAGLVRLDQVRPLVLERRVQPSAERESSGDSLFLLVLTGAFFLLLLVFI